MNRLFQERTITTRSIDMRIYARRPEQNPLVVLRNVRLILTLLIVCACSSCRAFAQDTQTTNPDSVAEQIQKLTESMAQTQTQLEQSQRQLDEMRRQLAALQRQLAQAGSTASAPPSTTPAPPSSPSPSPQAAPPATAAA